VIGSLAPDSVMTTLNYWRGLLAHSKRRPLLIHFLFHAHKELASFLLALLLATGLQGDQIFFGFLNLSVGVRNHLVPTDHLAGVTHRPKHGFLFAHFALVSRLLRLRQLVYLNRRRQIKQAFRCLLVSQTGLSVFAAARLIY